MRRGRFLAPGAMEGRRAGIYHCVSRVVDRQFVLGRAEKEQFVKLMRLYEAFCGVRVLAFCVMSNHFHLLVEVPLRPAGGLPERDLLARLSMLYGELEVEEVRQQLRERSRMGDAEGAEAIKEKYQYRMWDLSQFMKTLKQRFSQWFNKRHGRRGTLWEDRFKSVIVEDGYAARVISAYIDLNPLRAGLVSKPEDYRWCSYSEALAGKRQARSGIERIMSEFQALGAAGSRREPWRKVIANYRVILFADGAERLEENERTGRVGTARRGTPTEAVRRVKERGGTLTRPDLLRHRVRHFVEGAAIGMPAFVEEVFEASRDRFGPRRKSGARSIRGCDLELCALRDLRTGIG